MSQQRSSRKKRKRRQRARASDPATETQDSAEAMMERGYARGRIKDEQARAALVPLAEGERPGAVTVAAIVTGLLAAGNLVSFFVGVEVQGDQPEFAGILVYSLLLGMASYGCWKARYWAVLGVQAILAFAIIIFSLLAVKSGSIWELLIAVAVVLAAGTLFWKLVKAMARIQMPERPGQ